MTQADRPPSTLAELTTMRVGGPAARFVTATTEAELIDAVRETDEAGEPLLVLAGGSNLLISDDGFPGTVVIVRTSGIEVPDASACGGVTVTVAAGEVWDDVVAHACEQGWSGTEALSGIPGSTGATPVQNVGAYGQEVAQTIAQVRVWDREEQRVRTLFADDLHFTYRHSVLKDSMVGPAARAGAVTPRHVVLSVTFSLRPTELSQPVAYAALADGLGVELGSRVPLQEAREAVLAQRRNRGMVLDPADHDTWSCGSFFTNPILSAGDFETLRARAVERWGPDGPVPPQFTAPDAMVKTSAAWLIDRAGFSKGHGLPGPAALSTKHTLALTNRGDASAADLVALAQEVRAGVADAFGVSLVNEPVLVGLSL
ncbi:UDP-N-acetylmuramate dehydrogenase [Ornithinimicrobium cryptoxanthini]|uniref:UDP-N-acetylenolpyruvoylglucosamine reductase n=1 Tax=Ornithinimicrobium cryptoxanthini TaxID=2934161 RepID=A0ABY4YJV6_9MICO|nr:UDP-N-acetylmuramate dehydrogenase [Ornithinimicrobium cryptoxanthini]USQ76979.1 UDP-N-acetylmuramate dehydrogenase [Ornithinimicrobium cryptoxanthini]